MDQAAVAAGPVDLAGAPPEDLRQRLETLKADLGEASSLMEIYKITALVQQLAKASVEAAAARKAEAKQSAHDAQRAALLPAADDGVSLLLLGVPASWVAARLQAAAERSGAAITATEKPAGVEMGLLRFASTEDRKRFMAYHKKRPLAAGDAPFQLQLPGAPPPQPARPARPTPAAARTNGAGPSGPAADRKRRDPPAAAAGSDGAGADAAQAGRSAGAKQAKRDIRDAVCAWWDVPYGEQLMRKAATVKNALGNLTTAIKREYPRAGQPAWLAAAGAREDQCAVPLPAIIRSPQIEGYRNKAEFSVGLDSEERPSVGFLLGSYKDGFVTVADPSGCRHMSPTSLAYAAAMQEFIRTRSKLPAWDKRKTSNEGRVSHAGFWRLLVVREGRDTTFLPLPAAAGDTSGDASSRLVRGVPMAQLPLSRWAVAVPDSPEDSPEGKPDDLAATGLSTAMPSGAVAEAEPKAPVPEHVLLMVQVNPVVTNKPTMDAELKALGEHFQETAAAKGLTLSSIWVQHHTGVANAAPADAHTALLPGFEGPEGSGGLIRDSLCELSFRISPLAFFQVNAPATCLLYHLAGLWAAPTASTVLLDVCCGTGTIGISVAGRVKEVVGIDIVASAVSDAKKNAELNGTFNATWVCGSAESVIDAVLEKHAADADDVVAIVDPPRAGLHKAVLRALRGCDKIRRIVYIACNPASLAQDATALCRPARRDGTGEVLAPFAPIKALAFDLFPHTPHVESVMCLER